MKQRVLSNEYVIQKVLNKLPVSRAGENEDDETLDDMLDFVSDFKNFTDTIFSYDEDENDDFLGDYSKEKITQFLMEEALEINQHMKKVNPNWSYSLLDLVEETVDGIREQCHLSCLKEINHLKAKSVAAEKSKPKDKADADYNSVDYFQGRIEQAKDDWSMIERDRIWKALHNPTDLAYNYLNVKAEHLLSETLSDYYTSALTDKNIKTIRGLLQRKLDSYKKDEQ